MKDLAIITTCHNRLSHLSESISSWESKNAGAKVIVSCWNDDNAADWCLKNGVSHVRTDTPSPCFNKIEALRAGIRQAKLSDIGYVCLLDADCKTKKSLPEFDKGSVYICEPGKSDMTGIIAARTEFIYFAVESADGFVGYGAEDFWLRAASLLASNNKKFQTIPMDTFETISHSDRNWGGINKHMSMARNYINFLKLGQKSLYSTGRRESFFFSEEHKNSVPKRSLLQRAGQFLCYVSSGVNINV